MALDLFVNYERSSNSNIFYRPVLPSYTFIVKLSDTSLQTDADLDVLYDAEISINNEAYAPFVANGSGLFEKPLTFDTITPCICSVSVLVYADATNTVLKEFSLSGIFLNSIPAIDFIAYPQMYIDETTVTAVPLNDTNYNTSPGLYFYGEGHTETIQLSCNLLDPGYDINWFIGSSATDVTEMSSVSWFGVTKISTNEASTTIATVSLQTDSYPINVWATNTTITTSGPFISYRDSDGQAEFYPFFASSLTPQGTVDSSKKTNLRSNIDVRQYPASTQTSQVSVSSPFEQELLSLPLDYSKQTFLGLVSLSSDSQKRLLKEVILGTQWKVGASTTESSWEYPVTPLTATIVAYQFNLSYDKTTPLTYLDFFKTAGDTQTTVDVSASVFVGVKIDLKPKDWLPRVVYTSDIMLSAIVGPLPIAKLYIPNYYNLKNQDVVISIVETPEAPFELKKLTITSPSSNQTLVLSENNVPGVMKFNRSGIVDLSAVALLHNTETNKDQESSIVFSDMLEVVDPYDSEPIETYFKSPLTPINFTYIDQPKITPNEWAIADNINSIISKLHTTTTELLNYSKLYETKSKFYGWIGHKSTNNGTTLNSLLWSDLKCNFCVSNKTDNRFKSNYTWNLFTSIADNSNFSSQLTWNNNTCNLKQADPSCLGKYCTTWNWSSRKCGASDINISWREAKCGSQFEKKWIYEECELAPDLKNCKRDTWKISNKDFSSFPVVSCNTNVNCTYTDVAVGNLSGAFVIAYPTEVQLIDTTYQANTKDITFFADKIYSFQNISGISMNKEGLLFVLDSVIPRVSVFQIANNKFTYRSAWGTFGSVTSPLGFFNPQDIHIDYHNTVWVADTGNNCVKKFTTTGKHLLTITNESFNENAPLSISVDSKQLVHVLTNKEVLVFDKKGTFTFRYALAENVTGAKKIRPSYNREVMYITYDTGIVKYFRNGNLFEYLLQDYRCKDQLTLTGHTSIAQDLYRNVYVVTGDKILKIPDLQHNIDSKISTTGELFWNISDLLVHKEEYIQPWVYLKTFHRLWDNIELLRNSLFYDLDGCKSFKKATYQKSDLIIGQNEIVTNSVINRLSEQLWTNLQSLINYFDPNCEN